MEVGQMPDGPRRLRRLGTNFVGESVDGLWGWTGDIVFRRLDDLCAPRPAILIGPKRGKLYRTRVKIH